MFDNLSLGEDTRVGVLALCPPELRATARFDLTPTVGGGRLGCDAGSPLGGGETRPARGRDARPSGSNGGSSNAATAERLDDILNAITAQNSRLDALEQEQRAALAGQHAAAAGAALRTGTRGFDDSDLAVISASDRELIAELMKARPKDPVARQTPSAVPEAEVNTPVAGERDASASDPALEQVAGRPSNLFNVEKVGPKFKLLGA